jgi:hypothetical protein
MIRGAQALGKRAYDFGPGGARKLSQFFDGALKGPGVTLASDLNSDQESLLNGRQGGDWLSLRLFPPMHSESVY